MTSRIRKLLVANRGEICRRVFRSCRDLGIQTVAVYSEADATSAHRAEADQAIHIGAPPARDSYLCADKVLAAALETGADAIHPGYGFLAENAEFARSVLAAGLIWVGPDPDTIEAMGDKGRARDLAIAAEVPVVPGSRRFLEDLSGLEQAAETVGYPLMVKAAAGGGGIGMRRVDHPEKLLLVAEATRSMAAKAFGDGTIYLERFVPAARHVEIQVFGFGTGEAVHLYERDCSLQRRFQKVLEESPAPLFTPALRAQMAEAALRLCRITRYAGAGTVEFILDPASGSFFFLEMNTRIQVEHPVTEAVTGRDLVAMQILQAAGALPPLAQDDIPQQGHALECRIYAEDPARGFLPSPGTISRMIPPSPAPDLRLDTGYREGDTITPFYDPMIAKLIVTGADRAAAMARAIEALESFVIEGPKTNIAFLLACLRDPEIASGRVHTGLLELRRAELSAAISQGFAA